MIVVSFYDCLSFQTKTDFSFIEIETSHKMHTNLAHSIKRLFANVRPYAIDDIVDSNKTYLFRRNWSAWRMVSWCDRDWLKSISNSNLRRTDNFFRRQMEKYEEKNEMECCGFISTNAEQCVILLRNGEKKNIFNLISDRRCVDCTEIFDIRT